MILELNQAIDILQNKACPKPHGMTEEEKEELDRLKQEADGYQNENDKLSRMMADLTADNVRLRQTIRSSRTTNNTPPNINHIEAEEAAEMNRKYRQAKIKIEEQQRTIQMLQSKVNNSSNSSRSSMMNGSQPDDHLLRSIMSDKEKNTQLNKQLEGELRLERMQANRVYNELQEKKKEINSLQLELDQYTKALHETKQQLRSKTIECEQLHEKNDKIRVDSKDMAQLIKAASELQEDNDELVSVIQSRDQDIAALEAEVEKVIWYRIVHA
jgi:chromosome segregation ATPase